jgi:hypothetical protein
MKTSKTAKTAKTAKTSTRKARISSCVTKFMKNSKLNADKFSGDMIKQLKNKNKTGSMTKEDKQKIAEMKKRLDTFNEIMKSVMKQTVCNVGCKGTFLERGSPNDLPANFTRTRKEYPKQIMDNFKKLRKTTFGEKTNVLDENSMYDKIPEAYRKSLLKKGAVSYCSISKSEEY